MLWRSKEPKKLCHSCCRSMDWNLLEICSGSTLGELNSWVCQQFSTICRPAGQHVELDGVPHFKTVVGVESIFRWDGVVGCL